MEQDESTGLVRRELSYLVLLLAVFSFAAKPALAQETLFGPKDLRIGWFRIHLSFHKFTVDEPGEGTIIISKNKPEKKIRGGFARLNGKWFPLQSFLRGDTTVYEKSVNLRSRNYLFLLLLGDRGASISVEVRKKSLSPPPEVNFSANPPAIKLGEFCTLTWNVANAENVEIEPGMGKVDATGFLTVLPSETTTYTLRAEGEGGTATSSVTVTVYQPPTVTFSADPETVIYGETTTLYWNSTNADKVLIDQSIGEVGNEGSLEVKPDRATTFTITASGPGGSAQAQVVVAVKAKVEPQPEGSFGKQYEDLIPLDATIEAYAPWRFSVVTGLVHDLDGLPIADVSIAIHDHPEYGTSFTDGEGRFSIPVDGGGTIPVVYQKEGLITAHRKVYVPWNDIAVAETIKMIAEDPAATTLSFDGNPDTIVTHQSTEVSDEFGTRSCTMVFTGDNQAYEVDAQGTVIRELGEITTRATEFTTPESMPAILPPTSAYTYCTELSVDGVERVKFAQPVIIWVDNFLGFDEGEIVPAGYYDRDRGVWVASENGMVVRLLDNDSDGMVDGLDVNGDGLPDDLDGDGGVTDEVTGLNDSQRYPPGSIFWRVPVSHFTPWDFNWPKPGPPPDGIPPNTANSTVDQKKLVCKDCESVTGSFVEERSRIFHEYITIPGTDMALHYASNRVPGYHYHITVPASGDTVPASLKRIITKLTLAGRTFEQVLDPLPHQVAEFIWDGLDHLGRQARGTVLADVSVGFVYHTFYYRAPAAYERAFAQAGTQPTTVPAREELILWKPQKLPIYLMPKEYPEFGEGWTLSIHHHLSPRDTSTLYKGDGSVLQNQTNIITTVAGGGSPPDGLGDGGLAAEASLYRPEEVVVGPDGSLYILDTRHYRVRRVDPTGIITTVAGNGSRGYGGDGGFAVQAKIGSGGGICIGEDGSVYMADKENHRVRRVGPDGIINTVAGTGVSGYSGDYGPATQAQLSYPNDVTIGPDGSFYVLEGGHIRRIDPNGIITTVLGGGSTWISDCDGCRATEVKLGTNGKLSFAPDGSYYFSLYLYNGMYRVSSDGIVRNVTGERGPGYNGDEIPATQAKLYYPEGVAPGPETDFYIADALNHRLRWVDPDGIIHTVAGTGVAGYSGDGGPAVLAQLKNPIDVALAPDGILYIADYLNNRIRRVSPPLYSGGSLAGGEIAVADTNGLSYIFSSAGQHLKTINLDTGVSLYEFGYNGEKQLVSITDRFSNQTVINRDSSGVTLSITSSEDITTTLTID